MEWRVAYHFHLDDEIGINEAIELRTEKDPRAGDLYCHKSCFKGKSGSRLLTVKKGFNRKAHFRRWPGEYTKANANCSYQNISDSKRESMDYSQFYVRFQNFINEESKNTELYFIEEINSEELGEFVPDFIINHSKNNPYGFSQTKIHIIDENNRRRKKIGITRVEDNVATIVLRISEYTPEQLKDFKRGGVEKFELNWKYVCKQKMKENLLIDNKDITWEEKYSIDNPLEAKKRKKYLLDELKSHLSLRSDGIGLNASEYRKKITNSRIGTWREFINNNNNNNNCLSSIPFYDIIFSNEIEHDIIKKTNCKSVCIGCLDHRKKYEKCSEEICNEVNNDKVNNATVTKYCSLCLDQKYQGKSVYLETSWSELYSEQYRNTRWERTIRNNPREFYNFLNKFIFDNQQFGISDANSGSLKELHIGYKQALTGAQIDDLVSKFVTSFNSSDLIPKWSAIDTMIGSSGAKRLLGLWSGKTDYLKDPMNFRSSSILQQKYGCPKCGNLTGSSKYSKSKNGFLNYNLDCVCDQGRFSQDCDVCEGGDKNVGINELLLDFRCCKSNAWEKGDSWKNRVKWDRDGNLVCSYCTGYMSDENIILHREYFVEKLGKHYQLERVNEFFDLIGKSTIMSSHTYEELLYARRVDDTLANWYADPEKSWSRYIASNKI